MKKLLLSTLFIAFAVTVQAGDAKTDKAAAQDKPACCAKAKTMTAQDKAPCCSEAKTMTGECKGECPMMAKQAKATGQKTARLKQPALLSPKAASN
jgi:hypothetical protein